jgi:hypothetical protein
MVVSTASPPAFALTQQTVDARLTARTLEVLYGNRRIDAAELARLGRAYRAMHLVNYRLSTDLKAAHRDGLSRNVRWSRAEHETRSVSPPRPKIATYRVIFSRN